VRERHHTDDDLYRVHSLYLGPPGRTLPFKIPYRGLPVGAVAFVVGLTVLRAAGVSGLIPLYGTAAGFTYLVSAAIIRVTGPERPVHALLAIVAHEISGPRQRPPQPQSAVLRPGVVPASPTPQPPARPRWFRTARSKEGQRA
jgi:hypothetical protein